MSWGDTPVVFSQDIPPYLAWCTYLNQLPPYCSWSYPIMITHQSHLTWPWILVEPTWCLFWDIWQCCPNRFDVIHLLWDCAALFLETFEHEPSWMTTPIRMGSKDTHALTCPINSVCQLQHVSSSVIAHHRADFSKNLFKRICSQDNKPEIAIWIICLSLGYTYKHILDHWHHIEEELDWNKISTVISIKGED